MPNKRRNRAEKKRRGNGETHLHSFEICFLFHFRFGGCSFVHVVIIVLIIVPFTLGSCLPLFLQSADILKLVQVVERGSEL